MEENFCTAKNCTNKARRRGLCAKCGRKPIQMPWHGVTLSPADCSRIDGISDLTPAESVQADREKLKDKGALSVLRLKYAEALRTIEQQEADLGVLKVLGEQVESHVITPTQGSGTSEATAVLVASDWHMEERVGREIGGLNEYSLAIAQNRASTFFTSGLRLIRLLQQDVRIDTAIVPLLGDFITGQIHGAENAEANSLTPTDAVVFAQTQLLAGIDFLLNHTKLKLVLPCHSGNHARTTKTTRFASENGHSLEFLLYQHLAAYYRNEPRVEFIIPEGMHSYIDVYGKTIRFQHGHAIKYGGGVGGIYIPVNKAIAQWNKGRHADLDVFGHFHQMRDGGNFLCNGSLIGYNSFALSIKADYEPPKQTLFLMDKKRGRTCTWPILFND